MGMGTGGEERRRWVGQRKMGMGTGRRREDDG